MTEDERQHKIKRLRKQARLIRNAQTAFCLSFFVWPIIRLAEKHYGDWISTIYLSVMFPLWVTACAVRLFVQRKLIKGEWDDLGILLDTYHVSSKKAQIHRWKPLLKEQLLKVNGENRPALDFLQQSQLSGFLITENRDFILASLNALKWVGDENSLASIEVLSEGYGRARNDNQVQMAAIDTLSVLKARLEENERSDFLLRPSVAPVEPDSFLRPVSAPSQEEPATLLRAVNGSSDEVQ